MITNFMPSARPSKEETRKGHPGCPGPSGYLALLTIGGTLKKLGFASNKF
jgi:hypothetical protein